jgi:hypothetical protein
MIELVSPVFQRRVSVYRATRRTPTPATAAFIDTLWERMRAHPRWRAS